jgi:sugar lactone lactonase YvrE
MKSSRAPALLMCALAACLLGSRVASAITFNQPGYTQSILASLPAGNTAYGGLVEGPDGNVYATGSGGPDVFRVTPVGGVTTLALGATSVLLGVGIVGNTLYAGQSSGRIDTFDISQPTPTATYLTTIGGTLNSNGNADFAVAPAGFGAYGGKLISCNGGVYAVDPVTGAKTDIFVGGGDHYSSLGFGPNGMLYVADYDAAQVLTVSAAGATSVFASLPGTFPDGLAVQPTTGDIYVIDSSNGYAGAASILKITPAGVVSTFATNVSVSEGYYPSGLAFSNDGSTLYYLTVDQSSVLEVAAIKGFPAVAAANIPIPAVGPAGLLLLALLMAVAGAVMNRRALS